MLNVNVRITDPNTKLPTPVRLRINDANGKYYPPLGRLEYIPTGTGEDVGGSVKIDHEVWASIDGVCEVPLPAGVPLRFQVSKGPAWHGIDTTITLGAGQMSVRLDLKKFDIDSGFDIDFRAHLIDPAAASLEGAAEGLSMVHVLAKVHPILGSDGETYPTRPQLLNYSGQTQASDQHGCKVFVNTLNTHPVLGQLTLIHTHRPIHPLAFGGADGTDDWSLCDWADQAHRKGGLVVWCNPFEETLRNGGEALVALILGKIDAIELSAQPRKVPFLPMLYRLWNAGLFVPLVGSSGKQSNKTPLGALRTVTLGNDWIHSLQNMMNTITNGPKIDWEYDDDDRLLATARSTSAFEQFEVIVDGLVHQSTRGIPEDRVTTASIVSVIPKGFRWVALRCTSVDGKVFAHTCTFSTSSVASDLAAVASLANHLDKTEDWIQTEGRFANEKRRTQHLERIAQARAKLMTG
jgi:hypothetical protein